jgi:hypothetical protein
VGTPSDIFDDDLLAAIRDTALTAARDAGCSHAEVRVERIRSQWIRLRDARLESAADDTEIGVGVRVVREGSIGFAASVALTTDEVRHVVDQAVNAARVTAFAATTRVELAPEPSHGEVDWRSEYDTDPVEVPLVDKVELLAAWSAGLLAAPVISHTMASVLAVTEDTYFAARWPPSAGSASTPRSKPSPSTRWGAASRPCAPSPHPSAGAGSTWAATGGTGPPSSRPCPSSWPRRSQHRRSRAARWTS